MVTRSNAKTTFQTPPGVEVLGEITSAVQQVLTPEALAFVAELHRRFNNRREELLAVRACKIAASKLRGPLTAR